MQQYCNRKSPKLLDVLTAPDFSADDRLNVIKNEFKIKITKNIEEGVTTMCNVSYGIAKRAGEKRYVEGRAEGRAEGEAKGIIETLVTGIKSMMGTGQFNFDSAFKIINAPEDKYNLIKELVLG